MTVIGKILVFFNLALLVGLAWWAYRRPHGHLVRAAATLIFAGGIGNLLDRVLRPLNQEGSKRFLREARQKVWHNTSELHEARLAVPEMYATRLAELEVLSAAKVADLLAPGQVILKLTVAAFGVTLPPPA